MELITGFLLNPDSPIGREKRIRSMHERAKKMRGIIEEGKSEQEPVDTLSLLQKTLRIQKRAQQIRDERSKK